MNAIDESGSSSNVLDVRGLRVDIVVRDGTLRAVRGIDLRIARGEVLCLVGESGCGKSLASLALMGLLPKRATRRAEQLHFVGRDMQAWSERDLERVRGRRMSMIFQDPMTSLNPAYTIGDQLCEGIIRHRGVSRRVAASRARDLLERTGVAGAKDRMAQYPHQLSGGLRQRVVIAMALMCEPDLLIADEPTTALDVTTQAQILEILRTLRQDFGTAVLFITHDLGVVASIADHVAVMYAGEIVETAAATDLFAAPAHPYTRALIECLPVRGKTGRGRRLTAIPGIVPSLLDDVAGCAFRSRCGKADAACESTQRVTVLGDRHAVRCDRVQHWPMPAAA
jgi:peptide/nickel transport system ATP-binding protein